MGNILIHSYKKNYPVIFEADLKKRLRELCVEHRVHLLVDEKIWRNYKKMFGDVNAYSSFKIFDSVEENKTIQAATTYIEYLLKNHVHKDHKLVVVGGGLVQDIGSFVANIILRGIDWIFIPTTLLAMTDSCIGSKSGINVGAYKNQVGTFHPPSQIYLYLPFLDTLPQSEMVNGVGEILKHAIIKGGKPFLYVNKNINFLGKDKKVTKEIIYKSLLIKKEVIEKDEFEKNIRKILNYGHTFGHALEGYTNHKISHGEGVLIGMDIANFISLKLKILSTAEFIKMHKLIETYLNKDNVKISNYNKYMDFLSHDKKVIGDEVYAILSRGVGRIEIRKIKLDNKFKTLIKKYFETYRI